MGLRDQYEQLWASLISILVEQGVIRNDLNEDLLRIIGLGALNWVSTWYKEDGTHTLEEIGDFIWSFLMAGLVTSPATKKAPAKKKVAATKKAPVKKKVAATKKTPVKKKSTTKKKSV